jgi:NAD(P)-dependent dehydrogenase (short-subunit alcohol dehydrogenase family)
MVTGAARGIGAGIAEAFAREGAVVWFTDVRDGEGSERAVGAGGVYRHLDVREEEDWERVMAEVGPLDVLVNNAGVTGFEEAMRQQNPEEVTLEDWRAVHRTNLDGTFLGCRYGIRAMKAAGTGSIVNVSSRSGIVGVAAAAAYASSKAAIRNHTKSVALYCAEQGWRIRCNSIHPAAVLTPMWEPLLGEGAEREARMREFVGDTPLGRFGTVEEVAAVAVFLASDGSTYMTGAEMHVDGGILAGAVAARPNMGR